MRSSGSSARSRTADVGDTSRPSVNAWIHVRSAMPSRCASSSSARRWSMCEWTPPCETRPSRWTSPPRSRARRNAETSASFSKNDPSATARLTRWKSWSSTRPEPIVRWPTSELPIWPGRQADRLAGGGEPRVRVLGPEPVEHRRVGELDRVPRPGRRAAPPVEDDERYERERAAASHIAANESMSSERRRRARRRCPARPSAPPRCRA